jgi:hypothetical protein
MSYERVRARRAGHIRSTGSRRPDLDLGINRTLFVIKFVIIIGVHFQIVESEFFLDALLERLAFLESERVCLGDNWNDVDNV